MADVVYCSKVRIERVKGPLRRAYLPAEKEPVIFGVHGAVAEHYKVPPNVLEPHAATLDYVVAASVIPLISELVESGTSSWRSPSTVTLSPKRPAA